MVKLIKHDLEFILQQIKVAEAHSAAIEGISGTDAVSQIGNELRALIDSPLLPTGLRTVDGSYNNLVPGREKWGASGEPFPQLTQPNWVNENDDVIVFGAGSPGQIIFTDGNYGEHGPPSGPGGLGGGTLVDADPRTISNLIVDQTLDNPAALAAALRYSGLGESELPAAIVAIQAAHEATQSATQTAAAADAAADAAAAAAQAAFEAWQAAIQASDPNAPALADAYQAALIHSTTLAQQYADAAIAATNASAALADTLEEYGVQMDGSSVLLPNVAPDEGLSAPYNSWFTLFGQFFDHGLDLVKKGGNGTVYIPLQPDDPLYDPDSPHTNFMVMTRASIGDDAANVTTPWVDQNQTYASHASHQVFLREYELVDGRPVATGLLLEGANGGLATWKEIKDQAREMLGIELTDADVGMVPLLRTDPYGNFIPDPITGFAQVIVGLGADGVPNTADDEVISGTPDEPASLVNAIRTPNAFLDDIAHAAVPVVNGAGELQRDDDSEVGYSGGFNTRGQQTAYDDELLDTHYITGDGRGNENIGLTAVHFVFHAEHNRQIEQIKETVIASGDLAFINEWLITDISAIPADLDMLAWDGERLFQAARFATEMQYQHLVFEEFARKVQPDVDVFVVQPDVELNPAIFAEFANVVYRFGHSMLNETVDRTYADGTQSNIDLFDAFLNPIEFGESGISQAEMAGAIALGMSAQRGNEIDEFVTDVLRNQLVGIPLDLAALNIARGRDTGMPTLNQARAQFQEMSNGDTLLRPYTSWSDFAANIRNPESIINFIAAYGTHESITSETTIEGKRDAAMELVFGVDVNGDGIIAADRMAFLNATGDYAGGKLGGLNDVDLWIGGLAEKKMAFGGMLGSTFSFIFQLQMENLQDSDRFYYLSRTQGLNLLTELENNSLAKIVMRNTNLGEEGITLPADIFSTPDHIFYVDLAKQLQMTGTEDPTHDNPVLQAISALVERGVNYIRYNGLDHIVIQGTDGDDHIVSGGGDDTVWGGDGNDRIEAGYGVDSISGGAGDDIITSAGTDIGAISVLKGESGNDVIVDGTGMSLIFGGDGQDYLVSGYDDGEIRGGQGNDFIFGGDGIGALFGNEGDDWIEGGGGFDYIAGDNGELFFNSTVIGHDVLNGGSGDTDYDADSGDDIMFAGEGIQKNIGMWGHDWVIHQGQQTGADADMRIDIFTTLPLEVLRDRFSQVEGLSGWHHDDVLRGDDRAGNAPEGGTVVDPTPETGFRYNELDQAGIDRIAGLGDIITPDLMVEGQYWATGTWENGEVGETKQIFVGGNILLGGGGSDEIEGRGGDDVIDGDRYLAVRVTGQSTDGISFSVDSLEGTVTFDGVTKSLTSWMVEGRINPGTLQIIREILDGNQAGDEDTAVYWDVRENYEVTRNPDGSYTVEHVTQTAGAVDPATGRNRESDGTDRLYNIEKLRFADGTFDIDDIANSLATGAPLIVDLTPTNGLASPTEGLALSLDTTTVQDADGLGALSVQWQASIDGGATWTDIAGATGMTFTPGAAQVGATLRVVVSFTDGAGKLETLVSAVTAIVGDSWTASGESGDTFNGTDGDDIATGDGAANTLHGNGGDDILRGGEGDDIIYGGDGNDRIYANQGNDIVFGGDGDDYLSTGQGDDVLNGGAGNDILLGLLGNDTLNGGDGDDLIDGGAGIDTVVYSDAASGVTVDLAITTAQDTIGAGIDTILNVENIVGSAFNDTLTGNSQANTMVGGDGDDILTGREGDDVMYGGAGNDRLYGNQGNDIVFGGDGDDYLSTGQGDDFLDGGAGNDILLGLLGNDTLDGGAGDDFIYGGDGDDTITQVGSTGGRDFVDGGAGTDTYQLNGSEGAETFTIYSRAAALAAISGLSLAATTEIVIARNGAVIAELDNIEEIRVNALHVTSPGGASGGTSDGDTIQVVGDFTGTSLDFNTITIDGGDGDDMVDISELQSAHRIVFRSNGGNDTIVGSLRPQDVVELPAGTTLVDFEVTIDEETSLVTLTGDHHTISFTVSSDMPSFMDDYWDDDDAFPPPEPELGSTIGGTTIADILLGTAYADTIIALDGDDHVIAGDGDDVIRGGAGNDFLSGEDGRDMIFGGDGDDDILGGDGADMLYGDTGDDRMFGGAGNDLMDGGDGDDELNGGSGDDVFVASSGNDVYWGEAGSDTLDMARITSNATVDLGTGFMGRGSAVSVETGSDTLWSVENVVTGSGNDTITASAAVNIMDGGAGNDTFRFLSATDADGDTILGFQPGDRLDFSAIDANATQAGKQAFTLVTGSGFTGPGELMVTHEMREDGEYTVVSGTTSGSDAPEFRLSIKGYHDLSASDFNL